MAFLGEDYLLESVAAQDLYADIRNLAIVDPHNHADVREILENHHWNDIWEVEGATDHYVWELMRRRGVPEEKVTGGASSREKWNALASVFPSFAGNPTYEWIHLDLRRRFQIQENISAATADSIWEATRSALARDEMRPQEVLKSMKVEIMCTTDDPTLKLPFHEEVKKQRLSTRILPTWRPDKLMNIDHPNWAVSLEKLEEEQGKAIENLSNLLEAVQATHDYFGQIGCVASDHGLSEPSSGPVKQARAAEVFRKRRQGGQLDSEEIRDFKSFMLLHFAQLNEEKNWVMQLHIGPVRDYRFSLFSGLGPDSGGDISTHAIRIAENLQYLLNAFDEKLTVLLYCVDPSHLPTLTTLARAFPNVQLGAPWWWNDSPYGMETQLKYLASVDLLANHAGMVTDSRKLMSFDSRTEMFRRILCNVLGDMVVKGQIPEEIALDLAQSLSYRRPHDLFFAR